MLHHQAVDAALLGEFDLTSCNCDETTVFSTSLLTDTTWEYFISESPNPSSFGEVPSLLELNTEITNANLNNKWLPAVQAIDPGESGINDGLTLPYKQIPDIAPSAQFLDAFPAENMNYIVFRKAVPIPQNAVCVPEPSTIFGIGMIAGLGILSFSIKGNSGKQSM